MNTPLDDHTAAGVADALLSTVSRVLNGWSMVLGLAAVLMLVLHPVGFYPALALISSFAAGMAQAYFAVRCAFDAAVFKQLGGEAARYIQFDRVLSAWGMRSQSATTESLDRRVFGARRLLRWQGYAFGLQALLFGVGAVAHKSCA
ncbi:MAG TPA: hypothetical protein VM532_08750 [Burkholderiales bacterium]|jgi:hypothetical protein|nr:hypothetical protein [Burkholderiales bacterium]